MSRRMLLHAGIWIVSVAAACLVTARVVSGRLEGSARTGAAAVAAADRHEGEGHEGKGHEGEGHEGGKPEGEGHGEEEGGHAGHGHGGEGSDLDRPVEEMWAQKCEHKIPQYECDECRYEIGAVKLAGDVLSEGGKPGLVKVGAVGTGTFADARSFPGEVRFSEAKTVHVASPLPGVVRKVHADVGTRVAAGTPLLEIESQEAVEALGELRKREAARDLAGKTLERETRLFAKKISAEAEVQEAQGRLAEAEVDLENARTRLRNLGISGDAADARDGRGTAGATGRLVVRAPQAGVVVERHASLGERVDPSKDLFLLSDLSEAWVWANLREGDLPAVAGKAGRIPAEVQAPGGRTYRGTLDVLAGALDEETRTLRARVVIRNAGADLRPGMFVTVRLRLGGTSSGPAVPKGAVLADEGRPFVFVHKEGEYWIRRPVTLGRRSGDMVEIVKGVSPGQRIVADGSFLLKSDVLRSKMGAGCAD